MSNGFCRHCLDITCNGIHHSPLPPRLPPDHARPFPPTRATHPAARQARSTARQQHVRIPTPRQYTVPTPPIPFKHPSQICLSWPDHPPETQPSFRYGHFAEVMTQPPENRPSVVQQAPRVQYSPTPSTQSSMPEQRESSTQPPPKPGLKSHRKSQLAALLAGDEQIYAKELAQVYSIDSDQEWGNTNQAAPHKPVPPPRDDFRHEVRQREMPAPKHTRPRVPIQHNGCGILPSGVSPAPTTQPPPQLAREKKVRGMYMWPWEKPPSPCEEGYDKSWCLGNRIIERAPSRQAPFKEPLRDKPLRDAASRVPRIPRVPTPGTPKLEYSPRTMRKPAPLPLHMRLGGRADFGWDCDGAVEPRGPLNIHAASHRPSAVVEAERVRESMQVRHHLPTAVHGSPLYESHRLEEQPRSYGGMVPTGLESHHRRRGGCGRRRDSALVPSYEPARKVDYMPLDLRYG